MSPSVISPVEKVSSLLLDTRWVSAWEKSYSTTFKVQKYFLSFFYKNCSWRKVCYHVWFFFQAQNSSEIIRSSLIDVIFVLWLVWLNLTKSHLYKPFLLMSLFFLTSDSFKIKIQRLAQNLLKQVSIHVCFLKNIIINSQLQEKLINVDLLIQTANVIILFSNMMLTFAAAELPDVYI